MTAAEDLEIATLAKRNYRDWLLAFFFNVGPVAAAAKMKPFIRVRRDIKTLFNLKEVKRECLIDAQLTVWWEHCMRKGNDPMPRELQERFRAMNPPSKIPGYLEIPR